MNRRNKLGYEIRQEAHGEAEILIHDVIGEDIFGSGVSAKQVIEDLSNLDAKKVNVRINSPGGDVFQGDAIYNALRRHPAQIHTHIDGLAASAAATIAMAGEKIFIAENAFLMIHKSFALVMGNSVEMRARADVLDKMDNSISRIYAKRTGQTQNKILRLMEEETWFDSSEAKEIGFADEITEKAITKNHFDLSVFSHVPEGLLDQAGSLRDAGPAETERELEAKLRDVEGLSRAQAKAAISLCRDLYQRDAEPQLDAPDYERLGRVAAVRVN